MLPLPDLMADPRQAHRAQARADAARGPTTSKPTANARQRAAQPPAGPIRRQAAGKLWAAMDTTVDKFPKPAQGADRKVTLAAFMAMVVNEINAQANTYDQGGETDMADLLRNEAKRLESHTALVLNNRLFDGDLVLGQPLALPSMDGPAEERTIENLGLLGPKGETETESRTAGDLLAGPLALPSLDD